MKSALPPSNLKIKCFSMFQISSVQGSVVQLGVDYIKIKAKNSPLLDHSVWGNVLKLSSVLPLPP